MARRLAPSCATVRAEVVSEVHPPAPSRSPDRPRSTLAMSTTLITPDNREGLTRSPPVAVAVQVSEPPLRLTPPRRALLSAGWVLPEAKASRVPSISRRHSTRSAERKRRSPSPTGELCSCSCVARIAPSSSSDGLRMRSAGSGTGIAAADRPYPPTGSRRQGG